MSPLLADIVAKVENRATRKISRKLIFGLLRRCDAFQRHYGGPWSILDETIWSLTSPLVKRISGSKKFRSSPQKDFCNNIDPKRILPFGYPSQAHAFRDTLAPGQKRWIVGIPNILQATDGERWIK